MLNIYYMKWIKPFKVFEAMDDKDKQVVTDLKECILKFNDLFKFFVTGLGELCELSNQSNYDISEAPAIGISNDLQSSSSALGMPIENTIFNILLHCKYGIEPWEQNNVRFCSENGAKIEKKYVVFTNDHGFKINNSSVDRVYPAPTDRNIMLKNILERYMKLLVWYTPTTDPKKFGKIPQAYIRYAAAPLSGKTLKDFLFIGIIRQYCNYLLKEGNLMSLSKDRVFELSIKATHDMVTELRDYNIFRKMKNYPKFLDNLSVLGGEFDKAADMGERGFGD